MFCRLHRNDFVLITEWSTKASPQQILNKSYKTVLKYANAVRFLVKLQCLEMRVMSKNCNYQIELFICIVGVLPATCNQTSYKRGTLWRPNQKAYAAMQDKPQILECRGNMGLLATKEWRPNADECTIYHTPISRGRSQLAALMMSAQSNCVAEVLATALDERCSDKQLSPVERRVTLSCVLCKLLRQPFTLKLRKAPCVKNQARLQQS